jgi:hypothetical protein
MRRWRVARKGALSCIDVLVVRFGVLRYHRYDCVSKFAPAKARSHTVSKLLTLCDRSFHLRAGTSCLGTLCTILHHAAERHPEAQGER